MAFPVVAGTNTSTQTNSSATDQVVSLPASIASGDLLIILLGSVEDITWSTPSGWTELFNYAPLADRKLVGYYRVADGGEGSTVTVVTSSGSTSYHNSYRITDYASPPEAAAGATSGSGQPDPPSLSASGSGDNLWIAIAFSFDISPPVTAPTNYGNLLEAADSNIVLASARRENATGTEDPGAFGSFLGSSWVAQTIAVLPAGAAAASTRKTGDGLIRSRLLHSRHIR